MSKGIHISKFIDSEELLDLHWNQNMSLNDISLRFGYAPHSGKSSAICQLFVKRGLPHRTASESLRLRYQLNPEPFFRNRPMGTTHHKWNGGKRNNAGYILILKKGHPRADPLGYVREHLLVWEQTHNKTLPKGWIIHHINGIRDDNRPENLMAVSRSKHEHRTLVKVLQARIRELEQLHLNL